MVPDSRCESQADFVQQGRAVQYLPLGAVDVRHKSHVYFSDVSAATCVQKMNTSSYIACLRARVGHDLLLLPSVAAVIHDVEGRLLLQRKAGSEG